MSLICFDSLDIMSALNSQWWIILINNLVRRQLVVFFTILFMLFMVSIFMMLFNVIPRFYGIGLIHFFSQFNILIDRS